MFNGWNSLYERSSFEAHVHALVRSRLPFSFDFIIGSLSDALDSSKLVFCHQDVELSTLELCFSRRKDDKDIGIVCETVNDKIEDACLDRKAVELMGGVGFSIGSVIG